MRSTRPAAGLLLGTALLATALTGCGSNGAEPTDGSATERLEAIARRTLSGDIDAVEPLEQTYWRISGPRTVGVDVRIGAGPAEDGDLVRLTKGPATPVQPCSTADRCTVRTDATGTWQLAWDLVEPEEDPGYVAVYLHTNEDTRYLLLAGPDLAEDPRKARLPYVGSVERMEQILTDPAYAGVPLAAEGKKVRWTPRALAALVYSRLPASYGFHEIPGGIGFSAYGPSVGLRFLEGGGATTCPAGYTCSVDGDLTYAWADRGKAILLRQREGYVVRVDFQNRRTPITGPEDFATDDVLRQLVPLTADTELAPELSSDWTAFGSEVDWTGRG